MEVIDIALARLSDARKISLLSALLIEYGLPTTRYTEQRVIKAIRSDAKNVVVARRGNTVIGFGIMTYDEEWANLDLLAVLPKYQGSGLAQEIVHWLEQVALNAGIFTIEVQARAGNLRGIRFYEKLGYHFKNSVAKVYADEAQVRLVKRFN